MTKGIAFNTVLNLENCIIHNADGNNSSSTILKDFFSKEVLQIYLLFMYDRDSGMSHCFFLESLC